MDENDSIVHTATFDGNEFPNSQEVINSIVETHKEMAEHQNIKASGIAYNASVLISGKETDAIIIRLEHRSGYSVTIGLPYRIPFFKKIKYGQLFAEKGEKEIFT